jgi:hypothetical protein
MTDIFGLHNNTLQGADHLVQHCGYKIIVPDFFGGKPWDVDNIPPREGRPALDAWIQEVGSWEKVRPTLITVVERLRQEGATSIGVGTLQTSLRYKKSISNYPTGVWILLWREEACTGCPRRAL